MELSMRAECPGRLAHCLHIGRHYEFHTVFIKQLQTAYGSNSPAAPIRAQSEGKGQPPHGSNNSRRAWEEGVRRGKMKGMQAREQSAHNNDLQR
jgi:hypothetical protein